MILYILGIFIVSMVRRSTDDTKQILGSIIKIIRIFSTLRIILQKNMAIVVTPDIYVSLSNMVKKYLEDLIRYILLFDKFRKR